MSNLGSDHIKISVTLITGNVILKQKRCRILEQRNNAMVVIS